MKRRREPRGKGRPPRANFLYGPRYLCGSVSPATSRPAAGKEKPIMIYAS
jgi:hypothetical protein